MGRLEPCPEANTKIHAALALCCQAFYIDLIFRNLSFLYLACQWALHLCPAYGNHSVPCTNHQNMEEKLINSITQFVHRRVLPDTMLHDYATQNITSCVCSVIADDTGSQTIKKKIWKQTC